MDVTLECTCDYSASLSPNLWIERLKTFDLDFRLANNMKFNKFCLSFYHLLLQLHVFSFIFWEIRHWALRGRRKIILKKSWSRKGNFLIYQPTSPPHWSLRASSVAYFLTYSATFFLYSSGLKWNRNLTHFSKCVALDIFGKYPLLPVYGPEK